MWEYLSIHVNTVGWEEAASYSEQVAKQNQRVVLDNKVNLGLLSSLCP